MEVLGYTLAIGSEIGLYFSLVYESFFGFQISNLFAYLSTLYTVSLFVDARRRMIKVFS